MCKAIVHVGVSHSSALGASELIALEAALRDTIHASDDDRFCIGSAHILVGSFVDCRRVWPPPNDLRSNS